MPVIFHDTVAQDSHRTFFQRLANHPLESQIVGFIEKNGALAHATSDRKRNNWPVLLLEQSKQVPAG